MGINDNVDDVLHRNANVDPTTRQGNTYDGEDPPVLLREGPEDQTTDLIKDEEPTESPATSSADSPTYDPGDHLVAEVKDHITTHPEERDAVLEAERAGKNRVTLVDWLKSQEPAVP